VITLALIFGGRSAEHEISLNSARFVAANLDPARYRVVPVGILPSGGWVMPADMDAALRDGLSSTPSEPVALSVDPRRPGLVTAAGASVPLDFVFPILHGTSAKTVLFRAFWRWPGCRMPAPACWAAPSAWTKNS